MECGPSCALTVEGPLLVRQPVRRVSTVVSHVCRARSRAHTRHRAGCGLALASLSPGSLALSSAHTRSLLAVAPSVAPAHLLPINQEDPAASFRAPPQPRPTRTTRYIYHGHTPAREGHATIATCRDTPNREHLLAVRAASRKYSTTKGRGSQSYSRIAWRGNAVCADGKPPAMGHAHADALCGCGYAPRAAAHDRDKRHE